MVTEHEGCVGSAVTALMRLLPLHALQGRADLAVAAVPATCKLHGIGG